LSDRRFDVPADEHAAAVVAGVPLGEDVLVERAEVRRVAGYGGGALAQRVCCRAVKVALAISIAICRAASAVR